jgi:ribonuclease BN (tRNA processing enzyme)
MRLTIIGCGDAFGSGGRRQTSYLVEAAGDRLMIDCGATTLLGLGTLGIDPNTIPAVVVSHLHGDHFGGLVWWLIHAQHVARRTVPLTIVGPRSIEQRFVAAAEALFPECTRIKRRFELAFCEIEAGRPLEVGKARVTAYEVSHPSGAPSHALRVEAGGRTLAFSGDTEWVETLVSCATGADLLLAECYDFDRTTPYHMSWKVIEANLDRLGARRLMLTHMGEAMLASRDMVRHPAVLLAEDGMVVEV